MDTSGDWDQGNEAEHESVGEDERGDTQDTAVMTGIGAALLQPASPTVEELAEKIRAASDKEDEAIAAEAARIKTMAEANKVLEERVKKVKELEKRKREDDIARALKVTELAAQRRKLEEEANRFKAALSETNQGNATIADLHGKRPFVDVDGNYFMVRDQKNMSESSLQAFLSLRCRRLTDRGRHEALFGDGGIELDPGKIFKNIVQRGTTDVFGYGRLTEEELICWAPMELFEEVAHLPAMSADGVHTLQTGEARSLNWFLPKSESGPVTDLLTLKRALDNMEKVFMVQNSMLFEGMNRNTLLLLGTARVRFASPEYVVHWIEANIATFNHLMSLKYTSQIPVGWPADLASVENCRTLWIMLIARLEDNLNDFQQRVFERSSGDKSLGHPSMQADLARAKGWKTIPRSAEVDPDPAPPKGGGRKRQKKVAEGKSTQPIKPVKDTVQPDASTTPDPKKKVTGKVANVTPSKGDGPYCGAHIVGTLKLGDGCQFGDCKFVHLSDVAKAEMFRVDRSLCTGWGMKLGNPLQLKVWNAMVDKTKEGKKRPSSFTFKSNQPAFSFGKDT